MSLKDAKEFYPKSQAEWREWLQSNHIKEDAVWLVYHKKHTGISTIKWSNAVDEALCFGWIDSKAETIDKDTFRQYFCKRKPKSTWSKINKQKIEILSEKGLMTQAGLNVIELAKQNGSWTILDDVEDLIIPADLDIEFIKYPIAKEFYLSLSKSVRKMILSWIVLAKTDATRKKRINEIIENGRQCKKPKHL